MKVDRRLRKYKDSIYELCGKFGVSTPKNVKVMSNWKNKPEANLEGFCFNERNNLYSIKIRRFRMINNEKIERTDNEIMSSVCSTLAQVINLNSMNDCSALQSEMYMWSRQGK